MVNNFTDVLLIGFDCNGDKSSPVMIIGRKNKNDSLQILNTFKDKEAEDLYLKLLRSEDNNVFINNK